MGTRARSAGLALAVPMSRPRKTWRESAEMIGGGPAGRDERLRQLDRELGLAGRGGAGDDDERRRPGGCVGHAPTSAPRSAYGPACSIRTRTSRPTSAGRPARWTSLLPRVRPDSRLGRRPRPMRRRRRWRVAVVPVARSGWIASTRTATSRPSHASLRSRPIPSWSASSALSRRRLTSAGTSSARRSRRRPRPRRVGRGEDLVVADGLEQRAASPRTGPRSRRRTRR